MSKKNFLTKKEKAIFNAGVKAAVNEVYLYDGIIPEENERKYMKERIYEHCAYVLDKKKNQ